MNEAPIWTDDALDRLLGAMDGYLHAFLKIKVMIQRYDSDYAGQFNPRHTRKIERRAAITAPLRELAQQIEANMKRCQETYRREYHRAHPADRGGK